MLDRYLVVVLRQDGYLFKRLLKTKEIKTLSVFKHNGHRYDFDTKDAFFLKKYQKVDWRSPIALLKYFRLASTKKGFLIYEEPKDFSSWDYDKGEEIPVRPMKGGLTPTLLKAETIRGSVIDPSRFRTLALSPLYRDHIKKVRFGGSNTLFIILAIGVIAVILLILLTQTNIFTPVK